MTACVIPFRREQARDDKASRIGEARSVLAVMGAGFPLLELAYDALDGRDFATARAALDELRQEAAPGTHEAALNWLDTQITVLAITIKVAKELSERSA